MPVKLLLFLLLGLASPCAQSDRQAQNRNTAPDQSTLKVTYIANEGVLISSGEKVVLIDGLHREYKPDYAFPPAELLKLLESAQPPYDQIDLVLVSHEHLDHFHPESVGLHLQNNPQSVLVSSDQIVDGIKKDFKNFQAVEPRVRRIAHNWKSSVALKHAGIGLRVLSLRHGSAQFVGVQNLGYVVDIDGKKLLHLGDADMTPENFSSFNLPQEKIDIAFIPYWFLLSSNGRSLVKEQIGARHVVAVHISPAEADQVAAQLRSVYPDVITFTRILESKMF